MFRKSLVHYAIFVAALVCSAIPGRQATADDVKAQLDALRKSMEKYQDYTVAVRDLYLSTVGCVHYSHHHQHRDTTHALLRARGDPPCGRAAEKRDDLAPFQLFKLHSAACDLGPMCRISNWRG
jgi:hypothetical protein